MKKIALPVVLASAVLLAACKPTGPITGTEEQKAQKLAEIIAGGGAASCTIINLTDNSSVEMTVLGQKMKIVGTDFGQGKKGSMINDGVYTYVWEEGQASGFKTKNPTVEELQGGEMTKPEADTEKTAMVYEDETKYKVDCAQGGVREGEFTPPASVTFISPEEMQQMTPEELMKLYPAGE